MSTYFGKIRSLGFVVRNLDETLARFTRLGIGPFSAWIMSRRTRCGSRERTSISA